MKQPKYFLSRGLELKPTRIFQRAEPTLTSTQAEGLEAETVQQKRRVPQSLIFAVGFLLLFSISGLGLYTYIGPQRVLQLFPSLHPSQTTLISQVGQGNPTGLSFDVQTADGRVDIVKNFLDRYDSPLKPHDTYAQILVNVADKYNLDYRLLPAIMMQESNLCKAADPSIHNCLGFGIDKAETLSFDTYEQSFDAAAKTLKEKYIDEGLITPEQIMTKYTPSSNGSWAFSVNQWIAEMEYNDRQRGITSNTNANLTQYTGVQ